MTRPPTQQERDELRELLAKATAQPWESAQYDGTREHSIYHTTTNGGVKSRGVLFSAIDDSDEAMRDADLVAAAVNALPALIDAADRCERLETALGKMMRWAQMERVSIANADEFDADIEDARAALENK